MKVQVLLFASLPEIAGARALELEFDSAATLADVRAELERRWPAMAQIPFVFAQNQDYATDASAIANGDEIACVPAISGGAPGDEAPGGEAAPRTAFSFSQEVLEPRALEDAVRSDADGAIVTFLGVTRNHHDGKRVRGLAYEAYEEMACGKALAILDEVCAAHEVSRVHVVHRLGEVPIGEASIVVVAASAHRGPAFEAARDVMDRIKKEVPIFKREFFEGEEPSRWVGDLPVFE